MNYFLQILDFFVIMIIFMNVQKNRFNLSEVVNYFFTIYLSRLNFWVSTVTKT